MRSTFAKSADPLSPFDAGERRAEKRHTMVLRVGTLDDGSRTSICLVKNISSEGVQVRTYGPVAVDARVTLCIADEEALRGRVIWCHDGLAGVRFDQVLPPEALLRVQQKRASRRRRASPRVAAGAHATLRAGGRTYAARLRDISTSGAKIQTTRPVESSGPAMLDLPDMPPLQGYVRWADGTNLGLVFATPLPIAVIAAWLGARPRVQAG